jgi:hypothetical protein
MKNDVKGHVMRRRGNEGVLATTWLGKKAILLPVLATA